MTEGSIEAALDRARRGNGLVLWLTGAGISAESGIPTFRGPDGYWRVGARHYHPQELATAAAFEAMPDEVWGWYLYRRGVCEAAAPNAAHRALVDLEDQLGDRFLLITQNVDGLHRRAGTSLARHYRIHGDIGWMRCAIDCDPEPVPMPPGVEVDWEKGRPLDDATRARLVCPRCGSRSRPHVLWFDETYDEVHFRWDSSLRAAASADVLLVVGTSGATNLPLHVAGVAARARIPIIALNAEESPFTRAARDTGGVVRLGSAGALVPEIVDHIRVTVPTRS